MLHDDVFHSPNEVPMQFFHILVALLLHQRLTFIALRPIVEHHFITTYINIWRREKVRQLLDDIFDNAVVAFFSYTPHIVEFTTSRRLIGMCTTSHITKDSRGRKCMSRKVKFRNNHHVPLLGISYQLFHLLLSIVTTISFRTREIGRRNQFILTSPSPFTSQFRILLDFDSPTVVIGQMQMKLIEFMERHPVDVSFQIIQFEKGSRYIEHESTITETRCILYRYYLHGVFLQTKMFTGIDF